MASAHGPAGPDVSKLTHAIREYSLFKAVQHVLQKLQGESSDTRVDEHLLYERIEFQSNTSLGFSRSDVEQVTYFEQHGVRRARLRLNFLSLSGASSPLPASYTLQAQRCNNTADYLNWLNHRIHRLLYPIWCKYRYRAAYLPGARDAFSEQVFSLVGLGHGALRDSKDLDWKRLLPYLGLLSLRAHSAALIEAVLRYYFKQAQLFIEQCVPSQVNIKPVQLNSLGVANHRLGKDAVLGDCSPDREGKFNIYIRQLNWARFHEFLPNGNDYQPLCALTHFALRSSLMYDIKLQLKREEIHELRLAASSPCRLGWTTWLDHQHADGQVVFSGQLRAEDEASLEYMVNPGN